MHRVCIWTLSSLALLLTTLAIDDLQVPDSGMTPALRQVRNQSLFARQEFFALADFVCPGLLSPSLAVFNRVYGAPIAAAQDRNASEEQRRFGEDRQR